jgi:hypothetical protein
LQGPIMRGLDSRIHWKSSYGLPSPVTTRLWRRSHVEQGDD